MAAASADLMKAWARIVRVEQALHAAIEAELKTAGALPLDWYDVLLELSRAPDGRLSPRELEGEMLIAQYNLSRLVDRLEDGGLVKRLSHPGDGRRQWVEITEKGRKRRERSWPAYAAAVHKHAGGRLAPAEIRQLIELLGRLLPDRPPH